MKLCRFQLLEFDAKNVSRSAHETHPSARAGIIEGNRIHEIHGELAGARERTGKTWPLDEIKFLPPSAPSKIVCVGRNYLDHAKELGNDAPAQPLIFLKPPSSVIAPEEPIVLPRISQRVDHEGELAVVIARRCYHVPDGGSVEPYILGYTCLNDVTARDLQKARRAVHARQEFRHLLPLRSHPRNAARSFGRHRGNLREWNQETVWTHVGNDLFR